MHARSGWHGCVGAALLIALATAACSPSATSLAPFRSALPQAPRDLPLGTVEGALRVLHAEAGEADLGAAVVYLDAGRGDLGTRWAERTSLAFDGAGRLDPDLVAGTVGQSIRLEMTGGVMHSPFMISEAGTRSDVPIHGGVGLLKLADPGMLRIYCSLHRSERSVVYAARSPYLSRVDESGHYGINDVPAGAYRLVLWSEAISGPIRSIEVESGTVLDSPIWIDARKVPR